MECQFQERRNLIVLFLIVLAELKNYLNVDYGKTSLQHNDKLPKSKSCLAMGQPCTDKLTIMVSRFRQKLGGSFYLRCHAGRVTFQVFPVLKREF